MTTTRRNVAVLGCTGSIGRATLQVLSELGHPYQLFAASANRSRQLLEQIVSEFRPKVAALTDPSVGADPSWVGSCASASDNCQRMVGPESLVAIASAPEVDVVVAAIVGAAGLESCLAAAESGKRLALANKEALVVAGPILTELCRRSGAELLPVDSEHSAIFQSALAGGGNSEVERIVLTASGGSLRNWPKAKLSEATPEDALNHPTWKMGAKITIDSATMMNKALEIVEARWLFGLPASKIAVVIHPQSIIHSMVEFIDGSIVAQMSPPDMKLPIQYALTYPERRTSPARKLDWTETMQLDWFPADVERYPALELGFQVAEAGGSSGTVLNAANEAAVALFLDKQLNFPDITLAVRDVLRHHNFVNSPSLSELLELDAWARQEVLRWAKAVKGTCA